MGKKIAIITVYKNINYGSKLQSYALQHTLLKLGYNSENLILQPKVQNLSMQRKIVHIISTAIRNPSIIHMIIFRKVIKKRIEVFNNYLKKFIKESNKSPQDIIELEGLNTSPYSHYICGSDQIWAPNQFNEYYFLSFTKHKNKKIAYAPSIGLPTIPLNLIKHYKNLISGIGSVSIRENDGAEIIKEITDRDVPIVLDPTLLLTANEWVELMLSPLDKMQPYILCYFLGNNKQHRHWVAQKKKETGYKTIVLPFFKRDFLWGNKNMFVGPQEFISLIYNAKIVCTDSYHGILFSINLNKDFFAFLRFNEGEKLNQNSRVLNFLKRTNLMNRIVDLNNVNEYESINWDKINDYIDIERTKSIDFLKSALNKTI